MAINRHKKTFPFIEPCKMWGFFFGAIHEEAKQAS
jgi:hypothetical protein